MGMGITPHDKTQTSTVRERRPFRFILTGLFFVAIVLTILFTCISLKEFEKVVISQSEKNLLLLAQEEAKYLKEALNNIFADLDLLAGCPVFQNRIVSHIKESEIPAGEYSPFRKTFEHFKHFVNAFYVIDAKGRVLGRYPFKEKSEGSDYSKKPGVQSVMRYHLPHVSGVFITNSGKKSVSFCVPVFKNNEFIGILRSLIHLVSLREFLKNVKVGQKGYAWLIDDQGIVLSHPRRDHVGEHKIKKRKALFPNADWSELEGMVKRMISGDMGTQSYHSTWWSDEHPVIVRKRAAFAPINIGDKRWAIGVSMGHDEIIAPAKKFARHIFVGTGFLILVFVFIAIFLFRVQKKRIALETLAVAANELSAANRRLQKEIAERMKAEDEITKAAQMWKATFDAIPDMISIQDAEFRLIRVNRAYAEVFKMKTEDLIGRHCHELVHDKDGPIKRCPQQDSLKANQVVSKEIFEPKWGLYLEIRTAPIYRDGELLGIVHTMKDITKRKKAEEELEKRINNLEIFYKASIGREKRILALKEEIAALKEKYGGEKKI